MRNSLPKKYYKSIESIDYDLLKKNNIKCLIFDLDNTISPTDKNVVSKEKVELFKKINKEFIIYILSNNNHKTRLDEVSNIIGVKYISFALKPLSKGFRKIKKLENIKYNEMCVIGDQIVTDIIGGNRLGILTILVDPIGEDLKITSVNRKIEKVIIKNLKKKGLFKKGDYYE